MQAASQTAEAEKVPARKKKQRRGPDEGNILWKLYSELGSVRRAEFQALLKENSIHPFTFNSQTAATFNVSRMRASSFKLYRDFFLESGVDLNDHATATEPAQGTQKFDHNA
ncbi:hypothetical protein Q5H93_02890 [Hymenobacter sp. ASUV-10]|uniref:Uncharacterized protein n=1 Tax=Hymenobacter aranciens TaxID=3063996 RepID=A0ABT9B621_9BACT|nr:hypothetical protein [Hymenobacter sp. ASUV-10]MDO7873665.1 hypothetical protein [Hymenobacter sp. ASUV-10]